ncbi:YidC/Oxa1 family membrane protein insertase [Alicyclobacillus shizuokensis]|uniref:YidC/Oxa1 family membrane protein insertase n=1 Tax=Alicyclobacillus shizuokensis TaxID=392014 RepID=UPI000830B665|nr:membrane protein insertase YidC [Alicyclobacillus shizuokensis]MCL6625251.1 membrane protein insertase YidC [Alicyclobacillus shizuokensis]
MYGSIESLLHHLLFAMATYTHDWGLAIILLTVAVRLLLMPLSMRMLRNMDKQMAVAPHLRELAAKWNGSKEGLLTAQQDLLKRHGVRRSSSVLLPLLQAPVLYVVYQLFRTLNHPVTSMLVPWVPLTAVDPWHIAPLVAAVLLFLAGLVSHRPARLGAKIPGAVISGLVSLAVLWQAPVAAAIYYAISGLWGAGERWVYGHLAPKAAAA